MTWDLEEFHRLYDKVDEISEFLRSLDSKIVKSKVMGDKSIEIWNSYFSDMSTIDFQSDEFEKVEFEVEMYMESAVHFMHSTADILSQIVNNVVFVEPMSEKLVSISRINNQLSNQTEARGVLESLEELTKSKAFQYINAFTNVMKHRNLIGSYTQVEFGASTRNTIGLKFKEFYYSDQVYPSIYADDLMQLYFKDMETLINCVGSELNTFLLNQTEC